MEQRAEQGMLFPTSESGSDWETFDADGFSESVTGVVYRDGSSERGVPLGGLGTGFIALGTDGTLDYYSTIFNAFMERNQVAAQRGERDGLAVFTRHRSLIPSLRLPFLGLAVGDRSWVLSLQETEGVERAEQIHYWGHYPVADLEFELDAPVGVSLRAWVPFYPGGAVDSNVPGAVFEVRLRNETETVQEGTLTFSFHGPRHDELAFNAHGMRQPFKRRAEFQRQEIGGALAGVGVQTTFEEIDYSYILGVVGADRVRTGGEVLGSAWGEIARVSPGSQSTDPGASVSLDFSLQPGQTRTVHFVLSWYAPHWRARSGRGLGLSDYRHMYGTRFASCQDVAQYLAENHESLLERVLAWQATIYSEGRLPGWLQDALINVFAVLAQESFWMRSVDPGHWWGEEGFFCVNESLLSCPQQSCIANDEIGEWTVNIFFPELALKKLSAFKHYQKGNGQTPSTLGSGTEPDAPWFDQQLPVDGQVYVHMVDRYWQVTGDDRVLDAYYPSVKAGVNFMKNVDEDGDGLVDIKGSNQYYDNWPTMAGAAIHMAGYWLATLRIAERMAEEVGDSAFAEDCRAWIEQGSRSMEEKLWNEKVGSYLLYHEPETGTRSESILSDQLIGQYFSYLHGLPLVFPEDRVQTVMGTIWRINVASTPHGVRIALRPDGSSDEEGFYSTCIHPSYSSTVPASLLCYTGDGERGLELMRRTWHRLVVDLQMAWDMPGGLDPEGNHRWGLEYYHNTMLWTLPVAVLGQDLRAFRAPEGLGGRIVAAARS